MPATRKRDLTKDYSASHCYERGRKRMHSLFHLSHVNFLTRLFLSQNLFKSANYTAAIARYSAAAAVAVSRPPWESNQLMCEELSTVISNRSAAYFESRDYISALADAETVIQTRRKWSKGHFRKAKALLGLTRTKDAADAVKLGLSFEPTNTVRHIPLYDGLLIISILNRN
jgi:hypothetical protein